VNPYAQEAADIRKRFAEQAKALSDQSKSMYATQRQQKTDLYTDYKDEKSKLWKERGNSLSGVYEHAKADNQGEWHVLKNRQRGEYARLMNSIRKADFERQRNKKPLGLFMSVIEVWYNNTLISDLQKQHQRQRDSLAEYQKKRREGKLNERKAYHDTKASYAYSRYSEKKKQLEQQHDFDRKKTQERWKALNEARAKAWAELKTKQDHDRLKREQEAEQQRKRQSQPKKPTRPPSFAERFNQTAADAKKDTAQQQGMTDDAMKWDSGYGRGRGRRLE
jgi:hypothetical protein